MIQSTVSQQSIGGQWLVIQVNGQSHHEDQRYYKGARKIQSTQS